MQRILEGSRVVNIFSIRFPLNILDGIILYKAEFIVEFIQEMKPVAVHKKFPLQVIIGEIMAEILV